MTSRTLKKLNEVALKYPDKDLGAIIVAIIDLASPGETCGDKLNTICHMEDEYINEILDYMITGKVPTRVKEYNPWLGWIKT